MQTTTRAQTYMLAAAIGLPLGVGCQCNAGNGKDGDTSDAGDGGVDGDNGDAGDGGVDGDAGDAGGDAGTCGRNMPKGTCEGDALDCYCCPIGGPNVDCVCSTACSTDSDCNDDARPVCTKDVGREVGFCAPSLSFCCWGCE